MEHGPGCTTRTVRQSRAVTRRRLSKDAERDAPTGFTIQYGTVSPRTAGSRHVCRTHCRHRRHGRIRRVDSPAVPGSTRASAGSKSAALYWRYQAWSWRRGVVPSADRRGCRPALADCARPRLGPTRHERDHGPVFLDRAGSGRTLNGNDF